MLKIFLLLYVCNSKVSIQINKWILGKQDLQFSKPVQMIQLPGDSNPTHMISAHIPGN